MDFTQALTAFQTYLITEQRASTHTVNAYLSDLKQLATFLEKLDEPLDDITTDEVVDFIAYLKHQGCKASTITRKISSIKTFYEYLHERYKLPDISQQLYLPKIEQRLPQFLTTDQINQLFDYLETSDESARDVLMIKLLYAGGLRISELLSLKPEHFTTETGFVLVSGKRGRQRHVPLPETLIQLVTHYITLKPGMTYLFSRAQASNPITRQQAWLIIKTLVKKALGLDISPHVLRHSLATHLLAQGMGLRSLQMMLGHESIDTVQIYTHLERKSIRDLYDKAHPRK